MNSPNQNMEAAPIDAATLCEVAACLWEAALDFRAKEPGGPISEAARAYIADYGFSAARCNVSALAEECERAWLALDGDARDAIGAFDWEFCPVWLAKRLGWTPAPAEPESFVVVYDVQCELEDDECYYGYFASEAEARVRFDNLRNDDPAYRNARVCREVGRIADLGGAA